MPLPDATDLPTLHAVRFGEGGPCFEARADQPLLHSAEDAGLPLPSSCRNGTCRTCMQRLVRGQVHYRIAWPGLLAQEKAEGWILPCVAYPDSDIVLAQVLPVG